MSNEGKKKRKHWSGVQMQGFQTCIHIQLHQDNNVTEEAEHNTRNNRKIDAMKPKPQFKLRQTLGHNTDRVALLDTGSIFNPTNDKELAMNTMEAIHLMTSKTNVGQN